MYRKNARIYWESARDAYVVFIICIWPQNVFYRIQTVIRFLDVVASELANDAGYGRYVL